MRGMADPSGITVAPTLAASTLAVALGVACAVLAAAALWVMSAFNALASRRVRVQNGFAQIDVQLRRRHGP